MSYDIKIKDPETGETMNSDCSHTISGTTEFWLNITYNYAPFFYDVFGEKGIRTIYGMKVINSLYLIAGAYQKLEGEPDDDYWAATEGNAKKALHDLLKLAMLGLNGVWDGD